MGANRVRPPNLGIGLSFKSVHFDEIKQKEPSVDWFELIAENFIHPSAESLYQLDWLLERYPLVVHGVSLSIGSADPIDFEFLKHLKQLIKKTKTPWFSDHLSWGQRKGSHYHDLLPLPYRQDVASYVAKRAKMIQEFLEVPFALENVSSYVTYQADEMSEWLFYKQVVEEGDISMMLDVNNLYISSHNHGFAPTDYYLGLPLNRVIQIHLAGYADHGGYYFDSHDRVVADEVWKLYKEIYQLTGPVSTLLEWDDQFLPFQETWNEALRAKAFQQEVVCGEFSR